MPKLDGSGPEGKGPQTGRKLGKCRQEKADSESGSLGKGMGLRRKSGGGEGRGKRKQAN
ncbi:MAG TPA: DUF5320 domain-containing protein [Bacteroidales bacterium]|nr:DUF5320 domain-containing protein [Bacteroidales bacterium]HRW96517.1 DUF5320 domain-containing protein [Bacteroidales bacterium]